MKSISIQGLFLTTFVAMFFLLSGAALAGGVVIIANKSASVNSLSTDEIKNIFLAKKTQWENGQKIDFVTLENGTTHETFLKEHLQTSTTQFKRYFRTLVFTGKGKSPKAFNSEQELVVYVAKNQGAIGYISADTDKDGAVIIQAN